METYKPLLYFSLLVIPILVIVIIKETKRWKRSKEARQLCKELNSSDQAPTVTLCTFFKKINTTYTKFYFTAPAIIEHVRYTEYLCVHTGSMKYQFGKRRKWILMDVSIITSKDLSS